MSAREPKLPSDKAGVGAAMSKNHGIMATPQVNLTYPVATLGSRRERTGQEEHATCIILFASYRGNTGDLRKDAKAGGSRKARAV
jgi:hypothetical protein